MSLALGFALAAVVGTLARALTASRLNRPDFPFGTLAVNVVGSLLLGLLYDSSPEAVTVLGLAGLGSFTTFSTFTHESVVMQAEGKGLRAALYLGITVVAGIAAAAVGIALAA